MDEKQQSQQAIAKIFQIRKNYNNAAISGKRQYIQQFKESILKLVAYIRVQQNLAVITQLKGKLPILQEQLRAMRNALDKEEMQLAKKQPINNPQKQNFNQPTQKPDIKEQQKVPEKKNKVNQQDDQLEESALAAIVKQKPNIQWDDVAGLQQAKKVLQQAVILPIKFPQVFVGQRTPWKGILLYGPPGTGKTFLAKACATQMQGGTFFSISSSDLMSKYVGQSEKTLKALFRVARKQRPSIIFIDQIDSIAGQRSSDQNEASRRVKTQFLIQMQGVGNDCKDLLVLAATNLPWALDPAVRRRFEKRVYIPLPDIKGRLAMLKKVIEKNEIHINKQQMNNLANLTEGYSGSDISNMVNDALMTPVRMLDKTRRWMEVNIDGKIKYAPVPLNVGNDPNCKYFEGTMDDIKAKGFQLYLATKYEDFISALKSSKPSVSQGDLGRYIEFTKTFGMDG